MRVLASAVRTGLRKGRAWLKPLGRSRGFLFCTLMLTPEGQKLSTGEAAHETGDVEQWTPIGPTTLLAGQITDIASKAAVV
jgi:hypothetical protein